MANIALDLDGTLIEKRWPELGEWIPGAQEAVKELIDRGHHCYLYSARLSSKHPSGDVRDPAEVFVARAEVRALLDDAGLEQVDIWEGDKPFWHVLVDDRCLWFPGRNRSWRTMPDKIDARVAGARNRKVKP